MTKPTEFVRVKDTETGHEYTVHKQLAESNSKLTVLDDKAAVSANGRPLPPKTQPVGLPYNPDAGSPTPADPRPGQTAITQTSPAPAGKTSKES